MNSENLARPTVAPFPGADPALGLPELTDVHYDLWLLRVTVRFRHLDSPVYIEFGSVKGFRVLDEGDLLEFWNPALRVDGWLWSVRAGGWSALESTRSGFLSGITPRHEEYLVLGENDSVSVLTCEPPRIYAPAP